MAVDKGFNKFMTAAVIMLDIVCITMIGLVRTAYMLDAFSVSVIPIGASVLIFLFAKDYRPFGNRKDRIWVILLSIMFIVMLSLEEAVKMLLKMDGEPFNAVFRFVYPISLVFSVLTDVDYMLFKAESMGSDSLTGSDGAKITHRKFLGIYDAVWLLIPIMYVFAAAYFPGTLNSDLDLEWIGGGTPKWSDWHTVGFAFFVRLCTLVIRKPFMITVGQTLMYVLTANYTVKVLYRHFPNRKNIGYVYALLYMVFGSYCLMHVADMVKDNCSTPMLIAFAVSLLDHILSREHDKRGYINIVITGFLASIFRHTLVWVVAATVLCVAVSEVRRKDDDGKRMSRECRALAAAAAAIVSMYLLLTEVFAFGILGAEKNPAFVKYSIPMNLAGAMAYRNAVTGLPIDEDIVEKMEQIIPLEKWAEYYSPFDSDPLCREWYEIGSNVRKLNDKKTAADLLKVDWYYLTHYPKQCLLSYFDITSPVWEISKAPELAMYSPTPAGDFTEVHHLRKGSFYVFCESVKNFAASFAVGRAVVYRGGLYLFMLMVITVVMFRKRRIREWLAMLPIVMYAALLMFSIPQPTSRYTMGFSLFAVLFGMLSCILPAKGHDD